MITSPNFEIKLSFGIYYELETEEEAKKLALEYEQLLKSVSSLKQVVVVAKHNLNTGKWLLHVHIYLRPDTILTDTLSSLNALLESVEIEVQWTST